MTWSGFVLSIMSIGVSFLVMFLVLSLLSLRKRNLGPFKHRGGGK